MRTTRNAIASISLLVSLAFMCSSGLTAELKSDKPHLKDWFDAEWFDNLVKIPLLIDENSLWYANLIAVNTDDSGTLQDGGICMVDNNGATTIIFPDWKTGTPWYD